MKNSKIIILIATAVVMCIFVIFALVLRYTIQAKRSNAALKVTYRTVPAGDFDKLILSSHLNVRIRQGKECTVEFAEKSDSFKLAVTNRNGTLHLRTDPAIQYDNLTWLPVRITLPQVSEISADQFTEIQMGFFKRDSLSVFLGEGCVFTGNNNTLKHVSFKTSGNAVISITETF